MDTIYKHPWLLPGPPAGRVGREDAWRRDEVDASGYWDKLDDELKRDWAAANPQAARAPRA